MTFARKGEGVKKYPELADKQYINFAYLGTEARGVVGMVAEI